MLHSGDSAVDEEKNTHQHGLPGGGLASNDDDEIEVEEQEESSEFPAAGQGQRGEDPTAEQEGLTHDFTTDQDVEGTAEDLGAESEVEATAEDSAGEPETKAPDPGSSLVRKLAMRMLKKRDWSKPEVLHRLLGLPLVHFSPGISFVKVQVPGREQKEIWRPLHAVRRELSEVKTNVEARRDRRMQDNKNPDRNGMSDDDESGDLIPTELMGLSMVDAYALRPSEIAGVNVTNLSLVQFYSRFYRKKGRWQQYGTPVTVTITPALPRWEKHPRHADWCYQQLIAQHPWRGERPYNELTTPEELRSEYQRFLTYHKHLREEWIRTSVAEARADMNRGKGKSSKSKQKDDDTSSESSDASSAEEDESGETGVLSGENEDTYPTKRSRMQTKGQKALEQVARKLTDLDMVDETGPARDGESDDASGFGRVFDAAYRDNMIERLNLSEDQIRMLSTWTADQQAPFFDRGRLPEGDFTQGANAEQKVSLVHIQDEVQRINDILNAEPETDGQSENRTWAKIPFGLFVTGSGGTGKSWLINRSLQILEHAGHGFVVTATTGKAAASIGGQTLASAVKLPCGEDQEKPLIEMHNGLRYLSELQAIWCDKKWLIIDEISMLGKKGWYWLNQRLREICAPCDEDFGGLRLIIVGDMLQLPPVLDSAPWEQDKPGRPWETIGTKLYQRATSKVVFLENEERLTRTSPHYKSFKEFLRRYRYDLCVRADYDFLKSRFEENISAEERPKFEDSTYITFENAKVDADNLVRLRRSVVSSDEAIARIVAEYPPGQEASDSKKSHREFRGMRHEVYLAVGARVMLIQNVNQKIGLVNGSTGTVLGIIYGSDRLPPSLPLSVLVQIDDNCGYRGGSFFEDIPRVVSIVPKQSTTRNDAVGRYRNQLPLVMGWAVTIHKSQGQTFGLCNVDLGKSDNPLGLGYVAISRVKALENLILKGFPLMRLLRVNRPKVGGRWDCRLIEINRLIHIAKQGGQKGLAYVMPDPKTRYEQHWLRKKCNDILRRCEQMYGIRIPRPPLRMKGPKLPMKCKSSVASGHDTGFPPSHDTGPGHRSSQQQCESKSGVSENCSVPSLDIDFHATKPSEGSSQQQCESEGKNHTSVDKGAIENFLTSPAPSRFKDQSVAGVAGEASKIGGDRKKTKKLQQNGPGVRLQQLRLVSQEGKLSINNIDKKARLNFDRAMRPGEAMYTPQELREILHELRSWDSDSLPFDSLLNVITPGAEICTDVGREACRILGRQHPDVWGLQDPQLEHRREHTLSDRRYKQAFYDRMFAGAVNPAGLIASNFMHMIYVDPNHWSLLTSGDFARQANAKRAELGVIDSNDTGRWEPQQPVRIMNFGNTCYLNTALQAIAPMFTEVGVENLLPECNAGAACVVCSLRRVMSTLRREREFRSTEPLYHYPGDKSIHSFPFSDIRMSPSVMRSPIFHNSVDSKVRTERPRNEDLHTVITSVHEWEGVLVGKRLEARGVQTDVSLALVRINECMSIHNGPKADGPMGGWVAPAPMCQGGLPLQRLTVTHLRVTTCNHCQQQTTGILPVFPNYNAHPVECFMAEPLALDWPGETENDGSGVACTLQELVDYHFRDEVMTLYNCQGCCEGAARRTAIQRRQISQEEGPAWLVMAVVRVCLGFGQRKIVRKVKVSSLVNIPVTNIAGHVQNIPYQVVSLGSHIGQGSEGGHYVLYTSMPVRGDGLMYRISDSKVSTCQVSRGYMQCSTGLRLVVLKRMVNARPAPLLVCHHQRLYVQTSSQVGGLANSGGAGGTSGPGSQFVPRAKSLLVQSGPGSSDPLNTPPRSGMKGCDIGSSSVSASLAGEAEEGYEADFTLTTPDRAPKHVGIPSNPLPHRLAQTDVDSKRVRRNIVQERKWSDTLDYYDSIPKTDPDKVRKQSGISQLLEFGKISTCNLRIMKCPRQENGSNDCFVFAIAMAVSIIHGLGPIREGQYAGKSSVMMRWHLLRCLLRQRFSPFEDAA